MDLKKITEAFSVSPQIKASDIPTIRDAGIRTIICNRPDGEGSDQPAFEEIEVAAKAAGIVTHYVPVQSGMMTEAAVIAFSDALPGSPEPVLAYCRSGARSSTLWARLVEVTGRSA